MAAPAELERVVTRTSALLDAVRQVTLEEFRTEDAHFERDSRLGRELLYLISNNEWCRRTTEIVDVSKVQAVDTDIVVDVDLAYVDHEAFQPEEGLVWLPVLLLPALVPTHRRRGDPPVSRDPEPITSFDVTDAAGARVHKMTQAEVHQRLAAAISEIVLNVMANRPGQAETGIGGEIDREQKLLLSAAIRRMLPGAASVDRTVDVRAVPAGIGNARARLDDALSRDLETARLAVERAEGRELIEQDEEGTALAPVTSRTAPRPVLGSQIGEILEALIGTVFVVVAVPEPGVPQSFTVHVPSRRLRHFGVSWRRLQPRARLSIDLLAPTTHADRLIKLVMPDGVACLDSERAGDNRSLARIDVWLPGPFERLQTLMRRLFPDTLDRDRPVSWVDARIADMALHKVDAALDSLRHYEVASIGNDPPPPTRLGGMEERTAKVEERLRRLRGHLAVVRQAGPATASTPPMDDAWAGEAGPMTLLHECWDDGSWYPTTMRRRLLVNTASPDGVMFRATAVEDVNKRARPTRAQIDADVAVTDSPVFNVARFAGTMNLLLLAAVTAMLWVQHPTTDDQVQRELLATVLTLFSAVQASRVEHPDTSTLRGLLSQASYWVLLLSMIPTVLLAVAFAVVAPQYTDDCSLAALVAQALMVLRLRFGPLTGSLSRAPSLTLATIFGPDHARADGLRGRRSRALVAEALRLDREAHAYVVTMPAGEGQFTTLLDRSQSGPPTATQERIGRVAGRAARALTAAGIDVGNRGAVVGNGGPLLLTDRRRHAVNLLGVVQSATAGQAMAYLVFREKPPPNWADGQQQIRTVPLDPDRLAPAEPAEWVLEVVIGLPLEPVVMPLGDHPLRTVLSATAANNFRVMSVQLPAPAPAHRVDAEPRRWVRLRVAVPYQRGDTLRGLGSFMYAVQRLDGRRFGAGVVVADVLVSPDRPEPRSFEDAGVLTDRDFDVVPDAEAAGDPARRWRALAICGQARTGILHDVLVRLAATRPTFELAGMTAAVVHGQSVMFVLGRDAGDPGGGPALSEELPVGLRPGDQMSVVVDDWQAARTLDGVPSDDRLLLRVSIRTPDRPGVLRDMLRHLRRELAERAPRGVQLADLDVWFVLIQVVDGRSTRGRMTVRLPGTRRDWGHWERVNWRQVGRNVGVAAAQAWSTEAGGSVHHLGAGMTTPLLDDIVVSVDLLRSTAAMPPHRDLVITLDPAEGRPDATDAVTS